jgi:hypothetical protein
MQQGFSFYKSKKSVSFLYKFPCYKSQHFLVIDNQIYYFLQAQMRRQNGLLQQIKLPVTEYVRIICKTKRVYQKSEFINFTLATAAVNRVKLSKMDF